MLIAGQSRLMLSAEGASFREYSRRGQDSSAGACASVRGVVMMGDTHVAALHPIYAYEIPPHSIRPSAWSTPLIPDLRGKRLEWAQSTENRIRRPQPLYRSLT